MDVDVKATGYFGLVSNHQEFFNQGLFSKKDIVKFEEKCYSFGDKVEEGAGEDEDEEEEGEEVIQPHFLID